VRSIHVPTPRAEHTTTRVDVLDIRSVVVVEGGEYPARRTVARPPSSARHGLAAIGTDRLILSTTAPYDHRRISEAGRMLHG
jgi:hypothetical protein